MNQTEEQKYLDKIDHYSTCIGNVLAQIADTKSNQELLQLFVEIKNFNTFIQDALICLVHLRFGYIEKDELES